MSNGIVQKQNDSNKIISQKKLFELFIYSDGTLIWNIRKNKCKFGCNAGTERTDGRWQITFDYCTYLRSRLVWTFHNGDIPDGLQIDHIDGNFKNDKIENLRLATNKENNLNKNKNKNNSSGFRGVSWFKRNSKWRSYIVINGKQIHLGYFEKKEDAYLAYQKAAYNYHGSLNPHSLNQDSGK